MEERKQALSQLLSTPCNPRVSKKKSCEEEDPYPDNLFTVGHLPFLDLLFPHSFISHQEAAASALIGRFTGVSKAKPLNDATNTAGDSSSKMASGSKFQDALPQDGSPDGRALSLDSPQVRREKQVMFAYSSNRS